MQDKLDEIASVLSTLTFLWSKIKMKKIKIFTAVMSFAMLAFLGCKSKDTKQIEGDWNLVQYKINEKQVEFSCATISLLQDENLNIKVSGFSGVNSFSGLYKANGKKLIAEPGFISTKMMGSKEDMEFERLFLNSAVGADSWKTKKQNGKILLCIYNSTENSELIFAKASIKDTTWTLTAILKNNGVQSIDADQTELPTLTFNEENTASGFSGVNYYTMDYNLYEAAKKLSFKPGASTLMDSGSKEAQELEQQFYIYLDQTATYSIFGNTLTLRSKDGKTLLEFTK